MRILFAGVLSAGWLASVLSASAAVRYVWKDNPNTPVPPYASGWEGAATNIQQALDVSADGDTVLVTNGVYDAGSRVAPGDTTLKTRVIVTNAVTLVSVNGPEVTLIVGQPHSTGGLGDMAVRCVYLQTNSVLSGFAVTNGFTRSGTTSQLYYYGGGIRCEGLGALISNCVIAGNAAAMRGGGVYLGTLAGSQVISNSVLANGSAMGGGAYGVSAWSTRFEKNRATYSSADGGGAYASALSGCELIGNTAGRNGGGVYVSSAVRDCLFEDNVAGTSGGGGYYLGTVSNCIVRGNRSATYGGGICFAHLVMDSQVLSNRVAGASGDGGGFYGNTTSNRLVNCALEANEAVRNGGGAYNAVLSNCVVRANRATGASGAGGGCYANASSYQAYRTRFLDNVATGNGGGAFQGRYFSCVFSGNSAGSSGGFHGGSGHILSSCSVMGNTATVQYGGTYSGTISNCIVYANAAPAYPNYNSGTFSGSCSDPLPAGTSNLMANPLVSGYREPHLLPGSPLLGRGLFSAWMTNGQDADGDPRAAGGITDIGADQYTGTLPAGALSVAIEGDATTVFGYPSSWRAEAAGRVGAMVWDFGDGSACETNANPVTHTYAAKGAYTVRVTVTNETAGAQETVQVEIVDPFAYHVSPSGLHEPPFNTWEKAATNIQDAIDEALSGSTVLVTNGVYTLGGRAAAGQSVVSRACVDKALHLRSVEGPEKTVIVGYAHPSTGVGATAVRGVYLASGATLSGFTVSNGFTRSGTTLSEDYFGGGVLCAAADSRVSNCVVCACGSGVRGGGVYQGTLYDSRILTNTVFGSSTSGYGGGVAAVAAYGCRLELNLTAGANTDGGGAANSQLSGCELVANAAGRHGGGASGGSLSDCRVERNVSAQQGGGLYQPASVSNCQVVANTAGYHGGGISAGVVYDTLIASNQVAGASYDGGGFYGTGTSDWLVRCEVIGNAAPRNGGGVYNGMLSNCVVRANRATGTSASTGSGGGVYAGSAAYVTYRCRVLDNEANYRGGGAYQGTHYGGVFSGNRAAEGGGAFGYYGGYCALNSCSVLGNEASVQYGGVYAATVKNSIVYGNGAPADANWSGGTISYSCTDPLPSGTSNLTVNPLVSGFREPHLLPGSPLIGRGAVETWMTGAEDLDGQPRVLSGSTDIGADQHDGAALEGPLSVTLVTVTNICAVGWPFTVRAEATGFVSGIAWDLGDGSAVLDGVNPVTHVFEAPGDYLVRVTVTNRTDVAEASLTVHARLPTTFYVSPSGSHTPPFDTWEHAATVLQEAIDAAALLPGSTVLVTNGVYAAGGRTVSGQTLTNRACVAYQIHVRSVAGPGETVIAGAAHEGSADGGLGDAAVRAVYLAAGASLEGFTVTSGFTRSGAVSGDEYYGGGVFCAQADGLVSNCVIAGNSAAMRGGGACQGALVDCVVTSNTVRASNGYGGGIGDAVALGCVIGDNRVTGSGGDGGGAANSVLSRCAVRQNLATDAGGGAFGGVLSDCQVESNQTVSSGGGTYNAILSNCVVRSNRTLGSSATTGNGGGCYSGSTSYYAYRCSILDNEANYRGGGAYQGWFYSCVFSGNRAAQGGGFYGTVSYWLNSCSLMGNSASVLYGGVYSGTVKSCVVYGNEAPSYPNWHNATVTYSCAEPVPAGDGNTNVNPRVTGYRAPHLLPDSPLIGKGRVEAWMTGALDLDGEARVTDGLTDMGADQFSGAAASGPLAVALMTPTNVCVVGWPHAFYAEAEGRVGGLVWDFGDGSAWVTNLNPVTHAFADAGEYLVRVRVANETGTAEDSRLMQIVPAPVHYVSPAGGHAPPFTTWETAATNIQDAVDAALLPGSSVLVTNGVYAAGGRAAEGHTVTNRVWVPRVLRVSSVNGAAATLIVGAPDAGSTEGGLGDAAVRGVYLAAGASLTGFTVTNGFTRAGTASAADYFGGGVYCAADSCRITRCTLAGNGADMCGGGVYQGMLNDCQLEANTVEQQGGGAYNASLSNCLVRANRAVGSSSLTGMGGGTYDSAGTYPVLNCRYWDNVANYQGGGAYQGTFYSCVFSGNRAAYGGGSYGDTLSLGLYASSMMGNTASIRCGGAYSGFIKNSIVYGNEAPADPNVYNASVVYSCASPLPSGTGNLDVFPLVSGYREPNLLPGSPVIDRGLSEAWMAGAADMDGEPRGADLGADEFYGDALAGPLTVTIIAATNVCALDWPHVFRTEASGKVRSVNWDFGDGQAASGNTQVSHAFSAAGTLTVTVTVSNDTHSAVATYEVAVVDYARYVSLAGGHVPPFDTWERAATNIQDAVDAVGLSGGRVWVAAGVYDKGGRRFGTEGVTNRVIVTNDVRVCAAEGPAVTFIVGAPSPVGDPANVGLGDGATRAVRLLGNAQLIGFSVSNGFTRWTSGSTVNADYSGGGIYAPDTSAVISNCWVSGCVAACYGGGVYQGCVIGSRVTGNQARNASARGGGLYKSEMRGSLVKANTAPSGGGYGSDGASESVSGCVFADNLGVTGGGAYRGLFYDCLFTNNAAEGGAAGNGGGFYMPANFTPASALYRCRFVDNRASGHGGGAYGTATYYSSVFAGNTAAGNGGGVNNGVLEACSVLGNSGTYGGGAYMVTAYFSLLYYNTSALGSDNSVGGTLWGCCSYPERSGVSVTAAPRVTGFRNPHLLAGSPCINAGDSRPWTLGSQGLDIDGESRKTGWTVDIGADEYDAAGISGPLSVTVSADHAVIGASYAPTFRAEVVGLADTLVWDFGDGAGEADQNPVTHAFPGLGTYTVRVTVSNQTHSAQGQLTVEVVEGFTYVSLAGSHEPPFATWETAATNLQDAVDAALMGGTVWVTNGVYDTGGRPAFGYALTNRVCVEGKVVSVRSVEGPSRTVIAGRWHSPEVPEGAAAVRGAWLEDGASLTGFTITNGATRSADYSDREEYYGGGVFAGAGVTLSNCWVRGCRADSDGGGGYGGSWEDCEISACWSYNGGGIAEARLARCLISGNSADFEGGGASSCVASNCVVVGNAVLYSGEGGGVSYSDMTDCLVTSNSAADGGGAYGGVITRCTFTGNVATYGGGAEESSLAECVIEANQADYGGGTYSCYQEACSFIGNTANSQGGGACGGQFLSCLFAGNAAPGGDGGGVAALSASDWLVGCVLADNAAGRYGGGCYGGYLYDCLLTNNAATDGGGYYLPPSDLSGELYRCRLLDNRALRYGGGARGGVLYSCVIACNEAGSLGGGAHGAALESVSVLGNRAGQDGGGCYGCEAINSVIYHNASPEELDAAETTAVNGCTPVSGTVPGQPQVFGFRWPRLMPGSPCVDAGLARDWMAQGEGYDLEGEPRVQGLATDIGCDEWGALLSTGSVTVSVSAEPLSVAAGHPVVFRAESGGLPVGMIWQFGDGAVAVNGNPVSHPFATAGVYTVRVTVTNVTATAWADVQVTVAAGDAYVSPAGTHAAPFATWGTAATNIQAAVDAVPDGGTVHLADGVYERAGRPAASQALTNRVCIERPVTVRGFNGPSGVIIRGASHSSEADCGPAAIRAAYLGHRDARLIGVTLQGGATSDAGETQGGGVFCVSSKASVSNCVVTECAAAEEGGGASGGSLLLCALTANGADDGGGAFGAVLTRCEISGNWAMVSGGGASGCVLSNSVIAGNTAVTWDGGGVAECAAVGCGIVSNAAGTMGGGAADSTLISALLAGNTAALAGGAARSELANCTVCANTGSDDIGGVGWCQVANAIVWDNLASVASNAYESAFSHSAVWPLPTGAYDLGGNTDAEPAFVAPSVGDYRLQSGSPCINTGSNGWWTTGATDLDGKVRVISGVVDMGAYEFGSVEGHAAMGTPYTWLDAYGLGPDYDAAELDDPDHDGFKTWEEYVALTDPTDGNSYFLILDLTWLPDTRDISFNTAPGRVYTLQRSPSLSPLSWSDAASPVSGSGGRMTVTVSEPGPAYYYRVRVSLP